MKRIHLLFLTAFFLINACTPGLKMENIKDNEQKQTVEYQVSKNISIPLRNEDFSLVDYTTKDVFLAEMQKFKNDYPMTARSENEQKLSKEDFNLASNYSDATIYMKKRDYASLITNLNLLHKGYPDVYKYSDYAFMKGYAFDKLKQNDSASYYYQLFLSYSSQQYSARFHGYASADTDEEIYIWERNHARERLNGDTSKVLYTPRVFLPNYYYASFLPGYTFNKEEYKAHMFGSILIAPAKNMFGEFSVGVHSSIHLAKFLDVSPKLMYSKNVLEGSMALPLQVYKSQNNRMGIKLTPFFEYRRLKSPTIDEISHDLNTNWYNFGAKVSAGYYIMPRLALGAYYQYNFYNADNQFQASSTLDIGIDNEYDISAYYNLNKIINLKAGVKNNDIVAGLVISGWEVSYNFMEQGFIIRMNMY